MVKLTDRCFCCFTAAMLVPLGRAPTWRFHTKLYKFGWSTFPNNARMKNRTELNLSKVFYVWLIYHIQDFWLNLLNGYDIYFWLRDTANQPYGTRASSVSYISFRSPSKVLIATTFASLISTLWSLGLSNISTVGNSFKAPLWTLPKAPRPSSSINVIRSGGISHCCKGIMSAFNLSNEI